MSRICRAAAACLLALFPCLLSAQIVRVETVKDIEALDAETVTEVAGVNLTNAELKALARLKKLRSLDLSDSWVMSESLLHTMESWEERPDLGLNVRLVVVTETGLAELKALPALQSLDLGLRSMYGRSENKNIVERRRCISEAGFEAIAGIASLTSLNLDGVMPDWQGNMDQNAKSAAGIGNKLAALKRLSLRRMGCLDYWRAEELGPFLAPLTSLEHVAIDCEWGAETGKIIGGLGALKSLTSLDVTGTVEEATFAALCRAETLVELRIHYYGSLKGLDPLFGLKNLRVLQIAANGIPGQSQPALAGEKLSQLAGLESLELGGSCSVVPETFKHLASLKSLKRLALVAMGLTDGDLKVLGKLVTLEELSFSGASEITDQGIAYLGALVALRVLRLPGSRASEYHDFGTPGAPKNGGGRMVERVLITDKAFSTIAKMEKLEVLDAAGVARLSIAGIKELRSLKALKELSVWPGSANDQTASVLAEITSLEKLNLGGGVGEVSKDAKNELTDKGLRKLASLPRLRSLTAKCRPITDEGVAAFKGEYCSLEELNLDWCTLLTDKSLESLAGLKLRKLSIVAWKVTEKGLKQLASMDQLVELDASRTAVGRGFQGSLKHLRYLRDLRAEFLR